MGFYGEIINTGESPFVFDKIYTSRYHMERSMASDKIYAGRFILISYDSSYSHNDFKRVYIKDEDRGPNKTNINLYKDSDCTQVVKYKNFDEEIETAGEELASTLTEIYYVTDGNSYTYYKCSGNNNGIAVFDYYLDMNSLFNQVYRAASETNEDTTIRLFKDNECTEPIEIREVESTEGVLIGDVVFVEEKEAEASAKEQAQGVFSFYECTMQEDGIALFKKINTTTGHYQDETLENYIFNQKIDSLYFGNEGGVHNYDKTVWQKIYIGDKEKYIKVASLNSQFPKINLSIDPPETTITHAPYFDTDVNGQVEDLHIQPQWGLRVAAANKALSTKGSWVNPISGNYVNYEEGIKNAFRAHAKNILASRDARNIRRTNALETLNTNLSEKLNNTPWSSLENIVDIRTSLSNYMSSSEENIYINANELYNTSSIGEVESFSDSLNNQYLEITINDFYYCNQFETESSYKIIDTTSGYDENTSPVEEEWYEFDGSDYQLTEDTQIQSEKDYYIIIEDTFKEEILSIFEEASGIDLDTEIDSIYEEFILYFTSLRLTNEMYNKELAKYFWQTYGKVDNILTTVFSLEDSDYSTKLSDVILYLEDYDDLSLNYQIVDTTFEDDEDINPKESGWYEFDGSDYQLTEDTEIQSEKDYYVVNGTVEEAVENNYKLIQKIFEETGQIRSDETTSWTTVTSNGEAYSFDGNNWVEDSVRFPADIYYNKAGFDYTKTSKDETIVDSISITPTGFTQVYDEANDIWVNREFSNPNSDYTNTTIEAPDTQELSIHLPSIGNTISDVWDIVYGKGEASNDYKRKTNIAWDTSFNDRTRLINNTDEGGYTHSADQMATIAGAINTTQDLIGRIIVEDVNNFTSIEDEDLTSDYIQTYLNNNNIYYLSEDQAYYRINERFDFDVDNYNPAISYIDSENDYEDKVQGYTEVHLMDPKNLDSTYYYIGADGSSYYYSKNYSKNKSYVTFDFEEVEFEVEGFYTLPGDRTLFESDETATEGTYYNFNMSNDIVTGKYVFVPGEFYTYEPVDPINDPSGPQIFKAAATFNPFKNHYLPYTKDIVGENPETHETIYGTVKFVQVYTGTRDDFNVNPVTSILVRDENDLDLDAIASGGLNKDKFIFDCYVQHEDLNKVPTYLMGAISHFNDNDERIQYHWVNKTISAGVSYNIKPQVSNTQATSLDIEEQDGDNIFCGILKSKLDSGAYEPERSYQPNTYYYAVPSGYTNISNYILDTNQKYDANRTYYSLLNVHPVNLNVYEKNKYYTKSKYVVNLTAETYEIGKYFIFDTNTNTYVISNDPFDDSGETTYYAEGYLISVGEFDPSAETTYYEHNTYYVTKDYLSHSVGEIWDSSIPWHDGDEDYSRIITECHLVSQYDLHKIFELKELVGFGRQYNTINGLILKINQLLGDEYAADRNLETIYGSLRRLNDEVSRLSLYKSSVVEDIANAIVGSYTTAIEIVDQIKALRAEATGTSGGLLTENEAIHYYASTKDLETILGYHFDDETCRTKQDILYPFSENMEIADEVGKYQSYETIDGVEFYRLITEINDGDFTYQQGYINSNITDSTFPGVKTISDLNLPKLFDNSSSLAPRSIVDEIDHKVNIEAYYTDIGRAPMGMTMDPKDSVADVEVTGEETIEYVKGSILDRLYKIEDNLNDIEEVLYGNGLGTSSFDLTQGGWYLDENPIGTVALDKDINFTFEGDNEIYHHLKVTDFTVTYSSKDDEGNLDQMVSVFTNGKWINEKFRKLIFLPTETSDNNTTNTSNTVNEESGDEIDENEIDVITPETDVVTPETTTETNYSYPTRVSAQDPLYLWLKENAIHQLITYDEIDLTTDTYVPNKYYILQNGEYILATGSFENGQTYYQEIREDDPNGMPIIPGTSVFNPNSSVTNALKALNGNGLLARLSALDTSLEAISSALGENLSEEELQKIKSALVQVKTQAQTELTGTSTTETSDVGLIVPKNIKLLDVDAKYGFKLLQVKTSNYKYDKGTGETTWDYNIRIAFQPTAAITNFNEPFLQVDGLNLYDGSQKLNIINDAITTPNLDATISLDGKIYFSNHNTWPATSGTNAYIFLLSGHLVEVVKDDMVTSTYTVGFYPDTSTIQKNCSFKTSSIQQISMNNPTIIFPTNPTLNLCTFVGWMSGDGKLLIKPSDYADSRTVTPTNNSTLWNKMFRLADERNYVPTHNYYYPVFNWTKPDSAWISINGKLYYTTAKTQSMYSFIKAQKASGAIKIVRSTNYQILTTAGYISYDKKKKKYYIAKKAKYYWSKKFLKKQTTTNKNLANMSTYDVLVNKAKATVTQSGKFNGYKLIYISIGKPSKTSSFTKKTQLKSVVI